MYYHAAILLLFRPFLKAKFTQSDVSPSDVCRSSAAAISTIFDQHRRMYDSVGIYTFQIHCLLAACTIHIINTPAIASTQYLTSAANHFHHLAHINGWAAECINILKDLVHKWNIVLPMEAEQALYQDAPGGTVQSEIEASRGKRGAFSQPNVPPTPQQKKQRLSVPRMLNQSSSSISETSGASVPRTSITSTVASKHPAKLLPELSSNVAAQMSYLFAPFPNQPAPMLVPIHTSNVVETRLDTQILHPTLPDFDGLTFESETGWFDPFMGFDTVGNHGEGESRF
jgi:hypothetical protein